MQAIPASFRDRSGFVFKKDGEYLRSVHESYAEDYQHLIESGLYERLSKRKLLISHEELNDVELPKETIAILKPEQLSFISYAYEWSFSMWKDAALCTLYNALEAIHYGMILKDANSYNIQFFNGKPILIDTLSFEMLDETKPWIAYRQFVEHFLSPLLLMHYNSTALHKMLIAFPNGIPLEVTKSLLPKKARLNVNANLHIFLPAKYAAKEGDTQKEKSFSKQKLVNLLQSLKSFVAGLDGAKEKTVWDDYYSNTILKDGYIEEKKKIVSSYLEGLECKVLLDLGANDGEFSMLKANTDTLVLASDMDRNCIEFLYKRLKQEKIRNIHPLILDLTIPSPALGWDANERDDFFNRAKPDVTMALALIHHLAIGNNVPLANIIQSLKRLSPYLILEFVDKKDEKVQVLLQNREDIFHDYSLPHLKEQLSGHYEIMAEQALESTARHLLLLKRL